MSEYRDWREVVELALDEAMVAYPDGEVSCEQFVRTFRSFYDELCWESTITSWPLWPAASHRMAESMAREVWADDYSDRGLDVEAE